MSIYVSFVSEQKVFGSKVRFSYQCSDHLSHSKNFTSLFPLIFLSKHISLYALGRIRWILDIIWPLNQHFKLKNQRNWLKQVWMWKFWNVINCILLHWRKKLTSTLSEPTFFWVSHEPRGGGPIRPPPLVSQPWGIWGIGAKHNFCDHFSEDYFEVYKISLAQNLTILETIMRFCWKIQKIRTIF